MAIRDISYNEIDQIVNNLGQEPDLPIPTSKDYQFQNGVNYNFQNLVDYDFN